MSATPIPRTLEMAITGIREMSTITTPPEERHPILTYVGPQDEKQISAAIHRELLRDGQVFYIHNRVESIDRVAVKLKELVPEARIRVAHGQMSENMLEDVILGFWNRDFDVLVCTTIVESGLDIPNANTLIVENADKFGLSQLHQIRGRVGRGRDRAYAYFLFSADKPLTEVAIDRLNTIATNTDLGAGMQVALKDLEIRGAGNLLGGEQSGHIILKEHANTGDGLLTALQLMQVMAESKKTLQDLASVMVRFPQVLINVKDVDKSRLNSSPAIARAISDFENGLGDSGRILVRSSGTEPLVRVMVEAESHEVASQIANELAELVRLELK